MTAMITTSSRAFNKIVLSLLAGFLAIFATGCATRVVTDVNSFKTEDFTLANIPIAVQPSDPHFKNSLEFKHYKAKLEDRFSQYGFAVVNDPASARYIAKLGYHISDGETKTESRPVTGHTGYEPIIYTSVVQRPDGSHAYVHNTRWIPTYGIVGSSTRSYTNFTTLVTIDIVDQQQIVEENPAKVFELKARSEGSCGVVSRIFDEMLEAIFRDFPGENNRVDRVSVEADMSCYPEQ